MASVTDAVKVVVLDPFATIEFDPVKYKSTLATAPAVKITDFADEVIALAVAV